MRTARTSTRRLTRLLASAAVLSAALSLTACQNDSTDTSGKAPVGASQQSPGSPDTPAADSAKTGHTSPASASGGKSGTGGTEGTGHGADDGSSGASAASGGKGSGASGASSASGASGDSDGPVTTACTGAHMKLTAKKVSRPLNHMLLTATNTGSTPCNAYAAPYLRWDDAQAATRFYEGSKPQAVVTLAPGESAYAGIMYASPDGSGSEGYTAHRLGVFFTNRAANGSTGPSVTVALPKGGIHTDSSAWVTYWQTDAEAALRW